MYTERERQQWKILYYDGRKHVVAVFLITKQVLYVINAFACILHLYTA